MKKLLSPFLFLCCISILFVIVVSCTEDTPTQNTAINYVEDFEALWDNFDRLYPYFIYKNIDWQMLHDQYKPEAEEAASYIDLVNVMVKMLKPLKDTHVDFTRPTGTVIPTYVSAKKPNWDYSQLYNFLQQYDFKVFNDQWGYCFIDSIPYIAIGSWMNGAFDVQKFDEIFELFKESPIMIVDVRMNGGGNENLAIQVAGRFAVEKKVVEYYKVRNGPEHDDFGALVSKYCEPRGEWKFTKPVALLIGPTCLSSNESFICQMKEQQNVTLIGDTTGGGTANPITYQLSDGTKYRVPRWIAYTAQMKVVEWNGIEPEIFIPADENDFVNNRDPVLEYAVEWTKTIAKTK